MSKVEGVLLCRRKAKGPTALSIWEVGTNFKSLPANEVSMHTFVYEGAIF